MANWFETITKTLADDKLSRRQAMKKAAGITAAVAMAAAIPAGEAFAATPDNGKYTCKAPGTCSGAPFNNCYLKKYNNTNCFCFEHINKTTGVCGCNSYCASSAPCSSQADCASGYACISNTGCGCTTGLCVPKCTSTCILQANGAGRTAA